MESAGPPTENRRQYPQCPTRTGKSRSQFRGRTHPPSTCTAPLFRMESECSREDASQSSRTLRGTCRTSGRRVHVRCNRKLPGSVRCAQGRTRHRSSSTASDPGRRTHSDRRPGKGSTGCALPRSGPIVEPRAPARVGRVRSNVVESRREVVAELRRREEDPANLLGRNIKRQRPPCKECSRGGIGDRHIARPLSDRHRNLELRRLEPARRTYFGERRGIGRLYGCLCRGTSGDDKAKH